MITPVSINPRLARLYCLDRAWCPSCHYTLSIPRGCGGEIAGSFVAKKLEVLRSLCRDSLRCSLHQSEMLHTLSDGVGTNTQLPTRSADFRQNVDLLFSIIFTVPDCTFLLIFQFLISRSYQTFTSQGQALSHNYKTDYDRKQRSRYNSRPVEAEVGRSALRARSRRS